jgi:hypothetical protein
MKTESIHTGYNAHRLKSNPTERIFAEKWEEINTEGRDILAWILNTFSPTDGRQIKGVVSERDAEVAASVIQWLGSPVGQSWLQEVQELKDTLTPESYFRR